MNRQLSVVRIFSLDRGFRSFGHRSSYHNRIRAGTVLSPSIDGLDLRCQFCARGRPSLGDVRTNAMKRICQNACR